MLTRCLLILTVGASAFAATINTTSSCATVGVESSSDTTGCSVNGIYAGRASVNVYNISLPASGIAGNFGFSYDESASAGYGGPENPYGGWASSELSANVTEVIRADGPPRPGFVTFSFLDTCIHAVAYCSAWSAFDSAPADNLTHTVAVQLGDDVSLTSSVFARCNVNNLFDSSACFTGSDARVFFQFFEADGVSQVGFTEYLAPANLAVVDNPEPASFILLLVPAYLIKRWNHARLMYGVQR